MSATLDSLDITAESITRYNQRIPRYTSYPTAPYWTKDFNSEKYTEHLREHTKDASPLALYVHIPFCEKRCLFCGCNVIVTRKKEISDPYLKVLEKEIVLIRKHYQGDGRVIQLHLGGGTPNYLNHQQMTFLLDCLRSNFDFTPDTELSIEVDPRMATPEDIAFLYEAGYRRISFGVQDFYEETQLAIGREQTEKITFENVKTARAIGFKSVNIDLIYGLPKQTTESWQHSLDLIEELKPDRIALYNFAFLPSLLKHQTRLIESEMPSPELKLQMFIEAHNRLATNDWVFIGMDHYALKDDSLTKALEDHTLRRNFMGYNTLRGTDMLSFGVSSISEINGVFAQNVKKLKPHQRMIGEGVPPLERGLQLSDDDLLRKFIIEELMCSGILKFGEGDRYAGAITTIVNEEADRLKPLEDDGLIFSKENRLEVTSKGRIFLRNIAVVFDAYEKRKKEQHMFSKAV